MLGGSDPAGELAAGVRGGPDAVPDLGGTGSKAVERTKVGPEVPGLTYVSKHVISNA